MSHSNIAAKGLLIVDGAVFVLTRSQDSSFPGQPDLPGGLIERGESPEEALYRELWEEVGLTSDDVLIADVLDVHFFSNTFSYCIIYLLIPLRSIDVQLSDEHSGFTMASFSELEEVSWWASRAIDRAA